jgi:hypothetical protein
MNMIKIKINLCPDTHAFKNSKDWEELTPLQYCVQWLNFYKFIIYKMHDSMLRQSPE